MHTLRSQNTPIWPAAIRLSSSQAHQYVAGDKYDEHLQNHHFGWWWRWKWWWWVGGGGWRSRTTGRGKTSNAACWSFPWKHDEMGRMMITTFFLIILGSHIVLFFLNRSTNWNAYKKKITRLFSDEAVYSFSPAKIPEMQFSLYQQLQSQENSVPRNLSVTLPKLRNKIKC